MSSIESKQLTLMNKVINDLESLPLKYDEGKIEVNVVGLGWCRYKNSKERDENIVYCKNGVWKIKGDKTAYFDRDYCETESDDSSDEE